MAAKHSKDSTVASASSSSSSSKTLRSRALHAPSPHTNLKPNPRQQQDGSQPLSEYKPSKLPSRRNKAQYSASNHMPSPFFEPFQWVKWFKWRANMWVQATFVGGMLTDWESWSVAIVTLLLATVILYSLFFHLPTTVRALHKRATYYVYGSHTGGSGGGPAVEELLPPELTS